MKRAAVFGIGMAIILGAVVLALLEPPGRHGGYGQLWWGSQKPMGISTGVSRASAVVLCTPLGTLTTNLSLCKPSIGEQAWSDAINNNFDILDSTLSGLSGVTPGFGQLLIGNGTTFTVANLTGTANQVIVSNGAGAIGLSLPQSIALTSLVQFGGLGLGVAPGSTGQLKMAEKLILYNNLAPVDGQVLIGGTGAGNWTAAQIGGTANQVIVTNGNNAITLSAPQDLATASTPQFARLGIGTTAPATTGGITSAGVAFASLGAPANGTIVYCTDCDPAAVATCASVGAKTGALAIRMHAAWVCVGA